MRHAVALYVTSVLGPGALVLPALAARVAGPASLVAWALLAAASLPFAITFSSLSARRPESGGVYAFVREAFGSVPATIVSWLFLLWVAAGAPSVALIAGSYVGYAFALSRPESYVLGFAIVALAFGFNYRGIRLSARVQLGVIASILVLMAVTIGLAAGHVSPARFRPLAPDGWLAVGTAAALVFWAFLGYENVSNVAAEFEDPERDFPRSVGISVALVGALYFVLALVTIGTGAYAVGGGVAPFAAILGTVVGPPAAIGAAIFAAFIVFGTVNAYTAGISRVLYAAAEDRALPRALAVLDPRTRAPGRALIAMFAIAGASLALLYSVNLDLETALLVASGPAILIYVFGSAAGLRLYRADGGRSRRLGGAATLSLAISLIVLPFLGWYLLPTILLSVAGLGFALSRGPNSRLARPPSNGPLRG
jgi:amino acid efflux transporter